MTFFFGRWQAYTVQTALPTLPTRVLNLDCLSLKSFRPSPLVVLSLSFCSSPLHPTVTFLHRRFTTLLGRRALRQLQFLHPSPCPPRLRILAMPSLKKRSQNRLSSIFSTSSTTSDRSTTSDDGRLQAPSGFKAALPNKLYKASFARSTEQIPSGRKTPPVVPAPSSQQPGVLPRQRPISQQLNTDGPDFLPIPPPPTVFEPFHTRSHSQPPSGTSTPALSTPASESPQLLAPSNADQAKLKRRSWFGSSKDERHKGQANSAAWVLTHDGNLPYNLDLLVEAERVRFLFHY